MHFVVSATYGPTDPTRAMLPFIYAASALQSGDSVTLMLFADAVLMTVEGAGAKLVPVGPPNRYEEIAAHPNVNADGLQAVPGGPRPLSICPRQTGPACRDE
jgi:tRNA 2-thiouridine synthesizing protein D